MKATRTHRLATDKGFTLIELMVVVLIISVLIGIAIPTFLGARERAQDTAAHARLDLAVKAAEVYYTEHQTWVGLSHGRGRTRATWGFNAASGPILEAIEPALTFVRRLPANDTTSIVARVDNPTLDSANDAQSMTFWTLSESGTYFCIVTTKVAFDRWTLSDPPGVHRASSVNWRTVDGPGECLRRNPRGW